MKSLKILGLLFLLTASVFGGKPTEKKSHFCREKKHVPETKKNGKSRKYGNNASTRSRVTPWRCSKTSLGSGLKKDVSFAICTSAYDVLSCLLGDCSKHTSAIQDMKKVVVDLSECPMSKEEKDSRAYRKRTNISPNSLSHHEVSVSETSRTKRSVSQLESQNLDDKIDLI